MSFAMTLWRILTMTGASIVEANVEDVRNAIVEDIDNDMGHQA